MSLTVAPKLNLDTLNRLDANKQYYLSSSTGEVKEASAWMRFKCWLDIGGARQKVSNLIDAVRTTLLNAADTTQDSTLDTNIKTIRTDELVAGSALIDIATRFSKTNQAQIAKKAAEGVVNRLVNEFATHALEKHQGKAELKDLASIAKHALKPYLEQELPLCDGPNGTKMLDKNAFLGTLGEAKFNVEELLESILDSNALKDEKMDAHFAKHAIDTLFNEDGTRNDKTARNLKSPFAVKTDYAFQLNRPHVRRGAQGVYDNLVNMGVNPEQKLKQLLDFCNGDKELEDYVLDVAPELCCDTGMNMRTDETIKNSIANIKANLEVINQLQRRFPGSAEMLKNAMKQLGAVVMPRGMLNDMATLVQNAKLDTLKSLNSLSSATQIYKGIEELRVMLASFGTSTEISKRFYKDGDFEGAPCDKACHSAMIALALAKAGPAMMARLPSLVRTSEFGKMATITHVLNNKAQEAKLDVLDNNTQMEAAEITDNDKKAIDLLQENAEIICGEEVEINAPLANAIDFANDDDVTDMIQILDNANLGNDNS